jgi:hypothetical protein
MTKSSGPRTKLRCDVKLLFNFILREYGVADVKIQEVYALDDSLIELLPYFPLPVKCSHVLIHG